MLGCLSRRSRSVDPAPCVKMLDTVLMDGSGGGQAENFFFTAADGTVQRKAQRLLRFVLYFVRCWMSEHGTQPQLGVFLIRSSNEAFFFVCAADQDILSPNAAKNMIIYSEYDTVPAIPRSSSVQLLHAISTRVQHNPWYAGTSGSSKVHCLCQSNTAVTILTSVTSIFWGFDCKPQVQQVVKALPSVLV